MTHSISWINFYPANLNSFFKEMFENLWLIIIDNMHQHCWTQWQPHHSLSCYVKSEIRSQKYWCESVSLFSGKLVTGSLYLVEKERCWPITEETQLFQFCGYNRWQQFSSGCTVWHTPTWHTKILSSGDVIAWPVT